VLEGRGLAAQLARAGHSVLLSYSRDEARLQDLAARLGPQAAVGSVRDAVAFGEVVVLSVPWRLIDEVLRDAGELAGKVLVDTTNQFGAGGVERLPEGLTAARVNAGRMPGARVVKAFNTLTSGFQASQSGRPGAPVVIFLCGDDEPAKEIVGALIRDAGFAPCDLGGLDAAAPMEPPRRPGAVYGEEYRPAEAEEARSALAEGRPIPPTPSY